MEGLAWYSFTIERPRRNFRHGMIRLNLARTEKPLQILCVGSHSDDIEIGCGGTIFRLIEEHPDCQFHWVVFSAVEKRAQEARDAAAQFAGETRLSTLLLKDFRDGFLPFVGAEVKAVFEELKTAISPDVIFTHNRHDAHQDHRLIANLTWNTFRDHLILEYEIPKFDGDIGRPSVFMPLSADLTHKKVRLLCNVFESQRTKSWFRSDLFLSLMRLRGMECNAASGYAEAFYSRKLIL